MDKSEMINIFFYQNYLKKCDENKDRYLKNKRKRTRRKAKKEREDDEVIIS